MKVTISVGGKFHAFNLAEQLYKRGHLEKIITSYPRYKVCNKNLPQSKIVCLPLKEILQKLLNYIPCNKVERMNWYLASLFERQSIRHIAKCDIFVGWSSYALSCLRKAGSFGATTIIERGSSHIEYQRDILQEEYKRVGIRPKLPDPRIVEQELKEYQEADYISIPSRFVKRSFLLKGFPESKLILIPYGVDTDLFRPIPKEDSTFRVIYVGAISIRKGVHYILKAASELELKNFELCLIGRVDDDIKPLIKKYGGKFKFFGHINHAQLYRYYSQGSVFAIASIEEGLAMVIPQAMVCGLPVICTTNTGGEDIVRNEVDGFIIPARDTEALKAKILYFYENRKRCKEMGEAARERVCTHFTWDHYGERIVNSYLGLIK
jgi:glycosyltransferase involved in cell wall biosynthesis